MKKKVKLFLSMASMVLAVALFCFGVYAAVSVNYTISGTVTYQVKDVYTEITTKVYKDANMYNASNLQTKAQELEGKTFEEIEETYGQAVQTFNTYNNLTGTGEASASGIDINYNNAFTYYVVINVKNLSSSVNVNISLTNNTTGDINSVIYQTANKTNIAKLAEGTNMVVAFSLDDATKSVQDVAFNYSLKVELYTPSTGYTVTITTHDSASGVMGGWISKDLWGWYTDTGIEGGSKSIDETWEIELNNVKTITFWCEAYDDHVAVEKGEICINASNGETYFFAMPREDKTVVIEVTEDITITISQF